MSIFDVVSQFFGGKAVSQPPKQPIQPQEKKVSPKPQEKPKVVTPQVPPPDFSAEIRAAQAEARAIVVEAKDEALKIKQQAQQEQRNREEQLNRRQGAIEEREKLVNTLEKQVQQAKATVDRIVTEQTDKLEKVANMTRDEAREQLLKNMDARLDEELAKRIRQMEEKAKELADVKAREILIDAMKHGATNYVPEFTVTTVKLTDDDAKARIIGREGRNIRTFEKVTGVDVDLDEEGVIRLSSFDSVRREIARVVLERLIRDTRIQPARIEELYEQVKKDIEKIMYEEGEKLCHMVGVFNLPRQLVAMLGKFKYRTSYGQNMILHTLEETKIGIAIAQEVGADVNVVRLGCLLHDIGKIVMDEEGSHVDLGVELLRKYGMPESVIACVAEHHEDRPFSSIESIIVYISDAISGSRPGARYEDIEGYVKRLKTLEEIAKAHQGIAEAFAIQAGRELRVVVEPEKISDAQATVLAHEIKDEVEKKLTYPGTVKITVIREIRAVDVAK